ncbi:hypothetical protein J6590_027315 [Homalodisca vitripennis]|nr:hypothetical protein J6590_027315 [Homalodisca vitripennis]
MSGTNIEQQLKPVDRTSLERYIKCSQIGREPFMNWSRRSQMFGSVDNERWSALVCFVTFRLVEEHTI